MNVAPQAAPSGLQYRTCCDHPDCPTCAGHGGYYRLTAPAVTQQSPADIPQADARDAARYRWLRDNCYDTDPKSEGDAFDHPFLQFESEDLTPYDSSSLDAAIDAATTSTEGR